MELHKIMLGTLFTTLIVIGIMLFYSDGVITYAPTDNNNISLLNTSMYNRFTELQNTSESASTNLQTITNPESSLLDKIGAYFGSGYDTLKLVAGSFGTLDSMVSTSADQLGSTGSYVRTVRIMFTVALLIAIFVGIVLHALIKTDRI